jgi:hypothetical protein
MPTLEVRFICLPLRAASLRRDRAFAVALSCAHPGTLNDREMKKAT